MEFSSNILKFILFINPKKDYYREHFIAKSFYNIHTHVN